MIQGCLPLTKSWAELRSFPSRLVLPSLFPVIPATPLHAWFTRSLCPPELPSPSMAPSPRPPPRSTPLLGLVPHTHRSHIALASKLSADHVTSQLETLQWLKIKTTLQTPNPQFSPTCNNTRLWGLSLPAMPQITCTLGLCSSHGNLLSVPQILMFPLPQGPCTCCFFFCKLPSSLASSSLPILQVSIHVWLSSLTTQLLWFLSVSSIRHSLKPLLLFFMKHTGTHGTT